MSQTQGAYDAASAIQERAVKLHESMRSHLFEETGSKRLKVRFPIKVAAEMVGRNDVTIRRAEEAGELPMPEKKASGHRVGYSLDQVNRMRDHFGTRPGRAETDPVTVLGVQNFKGGVGKSTIALHAAQYLGLQGYRILLIDADPQASTTALFGYNPETDIEESQTLLPALELGRDHSIRESIRRTYWDGIDLIPACLGLYNAEYLLASENSGPLRFERLRGALLECGPELHDGVAAVVPPRDSD